MSYDQESYQSVSMPSQSSARSPVKAPTSGHFIETETGVVFSGNQDQGGITDTPIRSNTLAQGNNTLGPQNQYIMGQDSGNTAGSIWESARTSSGSKPSKITGDTIVSYGGTETTVAALAALGVVSKNPDGTYYLAGGPEWQNSNQGYQQQGNDNLEQSKALPSESNPEQQQYQELVDQGFDGLLPFEQEAALNNVIADIPQSSYTQAIIQAIDLDGDLSKMDWNEFSAKTGLPPEEAKSKAAFVQQLLQVKALQVMNEAGVPDAGAFIEWASKNKPNEFKQAQLELYVGRKTTLVKQLVEAHLKSLPVPSVDEFQRSGIEARQDGSGQIIVNAPGRGWVTAESLIKQGLIRRGRG